VPSARFRHAAEGAEARRASHPSRAADNEGPWHVATGSEVHIDPIKQFVIQPILSFGKIGGVDIAFTNSALFMFAAVGIIVGFMMMATSGRTLVPGRGQSLAEMWYGFIAGLVRDAMGSEGMRFFPLVFCLFSFVLICNLLGMIPYFFTVTSQIIVTFALAMLVITTVVVAGVMKHGIHWFGRFVPHGVPAPLLILLVPIEVISFLSRPLSLSLRLFANMLGGHIALKVFAYFVVILSSSLGAVGVLAAVGPFAMGIALTALEFLIAFLQALVFALLASIYLNDALHLEH
jgi:F-type H+-transporting ATPase subunit a